MKPEIFIVFIIISLGLISCQTETIPDDLLNIQPDSSTTIILTQPISKTEINGSTFVKDILPGVCVSVYNDFIIYNDSEFYITDHTEYVDDSIGKGTWVCRHGNSFIMISKSESEFRKSQMFDSQTYISITPLAIDIESTCLFQ